MKTLQTILILFLLTSITSATVRYVSKTGSSTPPYTTWETAADSIQKAIDVCEFGDTVYVGEGIYEEKIVMCEGLTLIGAGIDKTIIDMRNFPNDSYAAVTMADSTLFQGFTIQNEFAHYEGNFDSISGIFARFNSKKEYYCKIQNNKFIRFGDGIINYCANNIIKDNIFSECQYAIRINDTVYPDDVRISNNYFLNSYRGGYLGGLNIYATIENNFFITDSSHNSFDCIFGFGTYQLIVKNNICINIGETDYCIRNWPAYGTIENNTFVGIFKRNIGVSDLHNVRNNLIINRTNDEDSYGIWADSTMVKYNLVYMPNSSNHFKEFTADSTNIIEYPMLVDEEGHDFHLQMYSPAIDAGDPNIKDVDGSRSDIGAFGGPGGESYVYQDMPPLPPDIVTVDKEGISVTIKWERNTEADFDFYTLYKSINDDSTKYRILSTTQDTITTLFIDDQTVNQYFTLTATDKQGNESDIAEIISIITGIEEPEIAPESYKLFQNYPNPFNGETVITFQIPEAGTVEIFLYDVTGAKILEVANGFYQPGIYRETIDLSHRKQDSFASSIYFYRMQATNTNNQPIFNDNKKLIYLK